MKSMESTRMSKSPQKKLLRPNLICYNCGGKGHELHVCATHYDEDMSNYMLSHEGTDIHAADNHIDEFYLDPRSFVHVTYQRELLHHFTPVDSGEISGIDGDNLSDIIGTGTLFFSLPDGTKLTFRDVKYVPSCDRNLISVNRAVFRGSRWHVNYSNVYDLNRNLPIAIRTTPYHGLLYKLLFPCFPPKSYSTELEEKSDIPMRIYASIGYPSRDIVNDLAKTYPSYAKAIKSQLEDYTKSQKESSTVSRSSVKAPLELIHSTISGPFPEPSFDNQLYFVVFVDEYTHMKKLDVIRHKSEVLECTRSCFNQFEKFFQNRGDYKTVAFRTDDDCEYLSPQLQSFLETRGITHQYSASYSSYPNAVSKRAVRSISEKSRKMMLEASTPLSFWGEAVLCANYIINRLPSNAINMQCPYERWFRKKPNLDNLRPFGCEANVLLPTLSESLSFCAIRGIMVGYGLGNVYRIFDLDNGKVVASENVKFDEFSFPFKIMNEIPRGVFSLDNQLNDDVDSETVRSNDDTTAYELSRLFRAARFNKR